MFTATSRPMRSLLSTLLIGSAFTLSASAIAQSTPIPMEESNISSKVTEYAFQVAPNDHVIGEADAPNTLIVYASVVCGHCAKWFTHDYPIIKEELIDTGDLKLVFREFPTYPADIAVLGFQLANCAPQEDFMNVILHQMENQETTFEALKKGQAVEYFVQMSKLAGIESEADMFTCYENKNGLMRIEKSLERAQAAKVKAVPALILNEELMKGMNGAEHVLAALGKDISHLDQKDEIHDEHDHN
ncbi:MAG: thioredoxin domain-containing protein [Maricaulaceae bacterium]